MSHPQLDGEVEAGANGPVLPRVGFVLERSLGHLTHAETLADQLPRQQQIRADIAQLEFGVEGWPAKVPVFKSNWTVRAGVRARRAVREMTKAGPLDTLFVNTQVPAVLMPDRLRRIPTVVSLDATPLQFDELGEAYEHPVGHPRVERLKWRANRACFERADRIVTWSHWAKHGVAEGYGIGPEKIIVVPPGVAPSLWQRDRAAARPDGAVHILFVGGDLERKGGNQLIEVVQALRSHRPPAAPELVLDVVTRAEVPETPGVRIHRGLTPNSPELVTLFQRADVFALPTRGDCLPLALLEAGAAGLPMVSTAVAGIPEITVDGVTGLVVPPGDGAALGRALTTLADDAELRGRLGSAAAAHVSSHFDATKNTRRLVELMVEVASRGAAHRRG